MAATKKVRINGRIVTRPEYDVQVEISPDGQSYSSPMTTKSTNGIYYVRATITQHVGEPQWQGFILTWTKPNAHWTWYDGKSSTTIDEAVSNPLIVTRLVKAPASFGAVKFTAQVTKKYA